VYQLNSNIIELLVCQLATYNPEVNQEIQELKKELKELNQLVKALLTVTDEGGTVNADSLVIKMLKVKINKK